MNFLEKDLEQIIYEADKELLAEKGLRVNGKLLRQVRIGNYGIADLVSIERPYYHTYFKNHCKGTITIYELKKENISVSAFLQAVGYVKGIMRWMEQHPKNIEIISTSNYDINIVLIGKSIDKKSEFLYLADLLNTDNLGDNSLLDSFNLSLEMFIYDYDFNGINFTKIENYKLMNEGFKYE
jgi:hypothetical protein